MRLWSLHPKYLDSAGLVACWREALLAKKVLQGKTRGYRHHPQLRFIRCRSSSAAIRTFLRGLAAEASTRGFSFNKRLIGSGAGLPTKIIVTGDQLNYELKHLKQKLKLRDPARYRDLLKLKNIDSHPIFRVVSGKIEDWEIVRATAVKQSDW